MTIPNAVALAIAACLASPVAALAQGATPGGTDAGAAADCAEAASVVRGEPPGAGRALLSRAWVGDGCDALVSRAQGMTPVGFPAAPACALPRTGVGEGPARAAWIWRRCAEGATERDWGQPAGATAAGR